MRISDWSSDVCSSDLAGKGCPLQLYATNQCDIVADRHAILSEQIADPQPLLRGIEDERVQFIEKQIIGSANTGAPDNAMRTEGYVMLRSEEHTSELQSLMRISSAVFCLKQNNTIHS